MAKYLLNEDDIKKITARYVKSVQRNPANIPNIRDAIKEALKSTHPKRQITEEDITAVLFNLKHRPIINQNIILEASKKIADNSAHEDLVLTVTHFLKQMKGGYKIQPSDVETIISNGKLNPETSTPFQIKSAVSAFLASPARSDGATNPRGPKVTPVSHTPASTQNVPPKLDVPSVSVQSGDEVGPLNPNKLTFFEKTRAKMQRYGLKSLTSQARAWLSDNIAQLGKGPTRKRLLSEGESIEEAIIGKLCFYFYDAKTKDTLPYWDRFPLVFPIELYDDGFLGLNLHYLPRALRLKLFDTLLQYADNDKLDKIDKLRLSYQFLRGISAFPLVAPTIKRYLRDHIQSDIVMVEPVDWETALFLPTELFQKESKQTVWAKSKARSKRR